MKVWFCARLFYFSKMFRRGSAFWILYAAACMYFISQFLYYRKIDDYRNSVKMKAVVIDELERRGRRGAVYTYPQYSFRYNDTCFITADIRAHAMNFKIGDSVLIIFKRENPGDAEVYNFFRYWISLPHLLIGTVICLFIFFVVINIADYIDFKNNPDKY